MFRNVDVLCLLTLTMYHKTHTHTHTQTGSNIWLCGAQGGLPSSSYQRTGLLVDSRLVLNYTTRSKKITHSYKDTNWTRTRRVVIVNCEALGLSFVWFYNTRSLFSKRRRSQQFAFYNTPFARIDTQMAALLLTEDVSIFFKIQQRHYNFYKIF